LAGKPKETVNYFPHMCNASEGRTLYIMEHKYGNDGYTFWFKLLELLGSTAGHAFDFSDRENWQFLVARTRAPEEKARDMLKTLADVGAIDPDLYEIGVIWSDNFVLGLTQVYQKRTGEIPEKPTPDVVMSTRGKSNSVVGLAMPGGGREIPDDGPLRDGDDFPVIDDSMVSDIPEVTEVTEVTEEK
jgi:hypothetical protein